MPGSLNSPNARAIHKNISRRYSRVPGRPGQAPVSAEIDARIVLHNKSDEGLESPAIARSSKIAAPASLKGVTCGVNAGDVVTMPALSAAQAAEKFIRAIHAKAVEAVSLLMIDALCWKRRALMQQRCEVRLVRANHACPPGKPSSGFRANSFGMRGIAAATGPQRWIFHGLLMRMPMMKTT